VPDLANGQLPDKSLNKYHGISVYEAFTKFLSNLYGWKPWMREESRLLMSLIQDIPAEHLARLFHHYQEILTNQFHESKGDDPAGDQSPDPWDQTSEADRKLLIAAVQLSLMELNSTIHRDHRDTQSYYAKPGEAEWGCWTGLGKSYGSALLDNKGWLVFGRRS
jgi:hypothetical protein